ERQQRGRLREHFQLNVDIIGESDVTADAELLAVAIEIMRACGLASSDVRARVSDRRLLRAILGALGVDDASAPAVFAVVDKVGRQPREVSKEKLAAAGVAVAAVDTLLDLLGSVTLDELERRFGSAPGVAPLIGELRRYFACLEGLDVLEWVTIDLTIVRGLAYYTGIVFELFDAKGELRAICGGGRYDNLLKQSGGPDLPALGFGMGDVVLGELLRARTLMPAQAAGLDVWVAFGESAGVSDAMRVSSRLRARGLSVEYALGGQQLSRQLKAAGAAGAREAVILGAPDAAPDEATVRRLEDGHERRVRLDEWIDEAGPAAAARSTTHS